MAKERSAFDLGAVPEVFSVARLGWLIRLRWFALGGIAIAALLAWLGAFPGVNVVALLLIGLSAGFYNLLLWRSHHDGGPDGGRAGMAQALADMLLLTAVLWAAGGAENPFLSYYIFHVAIVGILAGARATLVAALAALLGAGFLELSTRVPQLQIGGWSPVPPWGLVAEITAFVSTVGTVAYLVNHAVRELREREAALASARDRAALEYELLSRTLDELDAGLEVIDGSGQAVWRNRRAEELAVRAPSPEACAFSGRPCEDFEHGCPLEEARAGRGPGRCRFARTTEAGERLFELLSFPLSSKDAGARVMNLYVDRTATMLADQRLLLAERLVSLGRVAQGVAHELNTPLATIRTLASDMRAALDELGASDSGETTSPVWADMYESASLVHDETLRLGKITQSLLAGGDLVSTRVTGAVSVASCVERACALVFAGVRHGPHLEIDASLSGLRVTADADRLVQVLVNLLQNAFDAVRERELGHVEVRAHREAGEVTIRVTDDGDGLAPEARNHLFEPFATTKAHGTGLGLYTSYMLVRGMRGDLALHDAPGGGTAAELRLPDGQASSLAEAREEAP